MEDIKKLLKEEIKYRRQLLENCSTLIQRSEERVNNINNMIGNLIEQNRFMGERLQACNDTVKREQEQNTRLLDIIEKKDERIAYLESLLDHIFIKNDVPVTQNNFHMQKRD